MPQHNTRALPGNWHAKHNNNGARKSCVHDTTQKKCSQVHASSIFQPTHCNPHQSNQPRPPRRISAHEAGNNSPPPCPIARHIKRPNETTTAGNSKHKETAANTSASPISSSGTTKSPHPRPPPPYPTRYKRRRGHQPHILFCGISRQTTRHFLY